MTVQRSLRPVRRTLTALGLVVVAAALAAGCGGDDSESDSASDSTTTTEAAETTEAEPEAETDTAPADATGATVLELGVVTGELKFDTDSLTAPAGPVTFRFNNTDTIPHNIAIRQDGEILEESELIAEDTVELTVDLEAGDYEFVCTPHVGAGMVGDLTIT